MELMGKEVEVTSFSSAKLFRGYLPSTKNEMIQESGVYYNEQEAKFECWAVLEDRKGKRPLLVTSIPETLVQEETKAGKQKQLWADAVKQIQKFLFRR